MREVQIFTNKKLFVLVENLEIRAHVTGTKIYTEFTEGAVLVTY